MTAQAIKENGKLRYLQIREKIAALGCLTIIALAAMIKLDDPENIVINVVVAVAAFISGGSVSRRSTDDPHNP